MMTNKCWSPTKEHIESSNIYKYTKYVNKTYSLKISSYSQLHKWSIDNIEDFWSSVWSFCNIKFSKSFKSIYNNTKVAPGIKWFDSSRLNFAENLLLYRNSSKIAIQYVNEFQVVNSLSYKELYSKVCIVEKYLIDQGVRKGDRVAAYMPNIPESVICMLATTSIGAIWTSCSPDFGVNGVLDRFLQVEPKILIASNGYFYKGKEINLSDRLNEIGVSLKSLKNILLINYISNEANQGLQIEYTSYKNLDRKNKKLTFAQLPFNHPVYIMYSSGTTGKPKSIVHSAGGTILQHKKELILHTGLCEGDSIFYFTTCGWMMWNWLVSSLSVGSKIVLYDGSPFHPDGLSLLNLIDKCEINFFGTSAQYISSLEKNNIYPKKYSNYNSLKSILSTGSPLTEDNYDFVYSQWKSDVHLASISGGTDIISCFVLGSQISSVYKGKIQCIGLGMDVKSYNELGQAQLNIKGELVCEKPFPSMPIYFWGDKDDAKYKDTYFSSYEDVWTHGDFISIGDDGQVQIFGRSDATLNPGGVRIGTAEIYSVIDKMDEIKDSVVTQTIIGSNDKIVLFVITNNALLDQRLIDLIKLNIKNSCSPRHIPNIIIEVPDIPYTINGKKVEIAVKRALNGESIPNIDSIINPKSLLYFKKINFKNA